MKITFITASLGSGGSERVVSLLSNSLSQRGHQLEIICLKYNDVFYSLAENIKITLAKKEVLSSNPIAEIRWLRKHIKKSETNIVIAFTEGVYCMTICSLLGTNIPVISSERNDPSSFSIPRKILRKIFLPITDWLVVQTQRIKETLSKRMQKKTSIIVNPVNEDVFNVKDIERSNQIISVARLYPQKNQSMLIHAFSMLSNDFPDWNLVIYGEGPSREDLEDEIKSLKMSERIKLPGRSKDVIDRLNESKIFCMSSDYEGMSNSMIEAVCVGLPIVSTRVSGSDELVSNEENGFLVECGDTNGMANSLRKLMSNADLCKQYGKESKKRAENFKTDIIVSQWETLIKEVLNH